jgi:transposase InsO family protein
MPIHNLVAPPVRLRLRGRIDRATETLGLRAAFTAAQLFGVAAGIALRQLRATSDPLAEALARVKEAELRAVVMGQMADILGTRFDKLPERKRPFYTPEQRFRILELGGLLGWPADQIARVFRVCTQTIRNWQKTADPEARAVGPTVRPTPPVTRFADVVRNTIALMTRVGFGSDATTAAVLTRAGWRLSERSVSRIRRERRHTPPPPSHPHRTTRPVVAHFVHHVWMMDVTEIQALLGPSFYLASVFDAFSRVPLALQTFKTRPGAPAMARLLKSAAQTFGAARYVITDQGGEFKNRVFRKAAARLSIKHRLGTIDRTFATARLERIWRTLKDSARLKLAAPLTVEDLERRLETALSHYLCFRPHQGLHGATPAEAFLGLEPAAKAAGSPPRAPLGEGPQQPPFAVEFLDLDSRSLPILKPAA